MLKGDPTMLQARQGKEIVVAMNNESGVLFDLAKHLAERGLSILAVSGTAGGGECQIRLVTDDNLRAKDTLTEAGYKPHEEEVVILEVPHKPGMLKRVAEVLKNESIDIDHVYASALESQDKCLLILHTTNDEHAIPKLNEAQGN